MKVPYQWLSEYVELDMTPEDMAEQLTMAGIEVEEVKEFCSKVPNLVAGRIEFLKPHPSADKLQLVKVFTGEQRLNIVCGAWNIKENDIVPVALPGCKLPGGLNVNKTEIRGELSEGMLCSAQELGLELALEDGEDGILILPADVAPGADINDVLNLNEKILELALTPNRSDCLGLLGVAQEISALTGAPLKEFNYTCEEADARAEEIIKVDIEEPTLCQRFTARYMEQVKVCPSPLFMQLRLLKVGLRPINNIVDITNYVMWETGQPLHAYDFEKLSGNKLIVRLSRPQEKLITLDGICRGLSPDMLVIADSSKAVGVAGVMGGEETEISASTNKVLLEAAHFNPVSVRKTAKSLGLPSEASQRFEKGSNPEMTITAQNRAAYLIAKYAGALIYKGIVDVYPKPFKPSFIEFDVKRVPKILGYQVPEERMKDILCSLGFEVNDKQEQGIWKVKTIASRNDISIEEDLIEEIARVEGYDKIPARLPQGRLTSGRLSTRQRVLNKIKNCLASAGLAEIITFSFMDPKRFDDINIPANHPLRNTLTISNPLSEDQKAMRTTLVPNMLQTLSFNFHRGNQNQRLFEMGAVFIPRENDTGQKLLPLEKLTLCLAATGKWYNSSWQKKEYTVDFYYLKGIIEKVFASLGINNLNFQKSQQPFLHPGRAAAIFYKSTCLGFLGELLPAISESLHAKNRVYLAELSLDLILPHANLTPRFKAVPKYPAVLRDFALIVPREVAAEELKRTIVEFGKPFIDSVQLFDVYEGKQIPERFKSIAFSVSFRHQERTLTDDEVEDVLSRICEELAKKFQASLRDF